MELLEGIDLQTLVERHGAIEPGRVRNILVQVCESLAEAHALGLVHRDIKPGNIFLSKVGLRYDHVKVLDFGLVKGIFTDDHTLTNTGGGAVGTPAYIAPEVAQGRQDIDGRADLYALGCVAYFLLTGRLVFEKSSLVAFALAHAQEPPIPPSQRTEFPVPASLEAVILDCLAKEPNRRPRSATDLALRLESLNDISTFTRDDAARWWKTNRPAVACRAPVEAQRGHELTLSILEAVA